MKGLWQVGVCVRVSVMLEGGWNTANNFTNHWVNTQPLDCLRICAVVCSPSNVCIRYCGTFLFPQTDFCMCTGSFRSIMEHAPLLHVRIRLPSPCPPRCGCFTFGNWFLFIWFVPSWNHTAIQKIHNNCITNISATSCCKCNWWIVHLEDWDSDY